MPVTRLTPGELLTRWTVRLSLACYLATAAGLLARRRRDDRFAAAIRVTWTLGCVLFLAHVAAAFHFYHHWSHAAAYRETARQSRERFGVDWGGGGLWLNYAFAAAWAADVLYWWAAGTRRYFARPRWVPAILHAFMLFMALNATVVFPQGPIRWAAAAGFAVLLLMWLGRRTAKT